MELFDINNLFKKNFDYFEIKTLHLVESEPSIFGYERCSPGKRPVVYDKDIFTIHFIIDGEGFLETPSGIRKLDRQACFFLPPKSGWRYYPSFKDPWKYAWVEIEGKKTESFLAKAPFKDNIMRLSDRIFGSIKKVLDEIFDEGKVAIEEESKSLYYTSLLLKIYSLLYREGEKQSPQVDKTEKRIKAEAIKEYLASHYSDPELSISKVADKFFFSPSYMTRLFKAEIGRSPVEYVIELRMEAALKLLEKKRWSLNNVASAVGYNSAFYFSKEFKKRFGISPSEYEKEASNKLGD